MKKTFILDTSVILYMQPLYDNLYYIRDSFKNTSEKNNRIDSMLETNKINIEPLAYLRGRSISKIFYIIDECFPYNQNIITENGKSRIGVLYNKFKKGLLVPDVLSFNVDLKDFEYKKIINVFHRGLQELVEIKFGKRKFKCTLNHLFMTTNGWKRAIDLRKGERSMLAELAATKL